MILAENDTEKLGGYQGKIKMEREPIRRGTILKDAADAWRLPISRCIVTTNHLYKAVVRPSRKEGQICRHFQHSAPGEPGDADGR
ncbi:MAG: hypothetical protein A2V87_03715 [Deltaproteobacteria bacterium RBG_16_58_17]|nr:MAG: hypothetical protein A2V87_03715 [Deltaproteobacteria bacterium RBG_16_58_17]